MLSALSSSVIKSTGLSDGESFSSTLHPSMTAQRSLSVVRQFVDKLFFVFFTLRDFRRTFATIRYTMKTIWTIYDERTTYIAKNAIFKLKIFNISNLFHVVSPLWGLIVD